VVLMMTLPHFIKPDVQDNNYPKHRHNHKSQVQMKVDDPLLLSTLMTVVVLTLFSHHHHSDFQKFLASKPSQNLIQEMNKVRDDSDDCFYQQWEACTPLQ
jgi:hypothetical protein